MLSQYVSIEKQNEIAAIYEAIDRLKNNEINVMKAILPIDMEEKKLGRLIEVLSIQKEILEKQIKAKQFNVSMKMLYEQALAECMIGFIEGYEELVKAREQVFINGQFVATKPIRTKLVNEFNKMLVTESKEWPPFPLMHYKDEVANKVANEVEDDDSLYACDELTCKDHVDRLKKEIKSLTSKLLELMDQKTKLSEDLQAHQTACGKKSHLAGKLKETMTTESQNALPDVVLAGNFTLAKKLINQQSKRKDYINKVGINGYNALHAACMTGNLDFVNELLKHGASVTVKSVDGYSPIHFCVQQSTQNMCAILDRLLKANAWIDTKGPYDQTPLHTAAWFGNVDGVKALLERKAYINAQESAKSNQRTPLHSAAARGFAPVVEFLLSQGANPNARNIQGETPLFEALYNGNFVAAQVFLDYGLWMTKKDRLFFINHCNLTNHQNILEAVAGFIDLASYEFKAALEKPSLSSQKEKNAYKKNNIFATKNEESKADLENKVEGEIEDEIKIENDFHK